MLVAGQERRSIRCFFPTKQMPLSLSSGTGNKSAEMEETAMGLDLSLHNTPLNTITTDPLIKQNSENRFVNCTGET